MNKKGNKYIGKMIMGDERGYTRPFSRRAQIFYLLRHYLPTILLSSLMMAFFAAPFPILIIVTRSMINNAIKLSPEYVSSIVLTYNFYTFLIAIPLIMLFGLGMCGMNNVIKRLALEQGANIYNFYEGIKENWKTYLFSYFLFGVSLFALINGINVLNARAGDLLPFVYGISFGLLIVQFIIFSLFTFVSSFLSLLYGMRFTDYLKNTFKITFRGLFMHILFAALAISLWIFPIFMPYWISLGFYIATIVLGPIISSFSTMLYGCFYTDKYINYDMYPEYYHRGLHDYIERLDDKEE